MSRAGHLAVAALLLASPLLGQNTKALSNRIQGVWRVEERVTMGSDTSTVSSPQPGLYIFTRRHYSIVQIGGTDARPETPRFQDPERPTDAEKAAMFEHWDPVAANSGTYTLEGTKLTTRPLVAKNQSVITAGPQVREVRLQGNTLWLTARSPVGQPPVTTRTKLVRVE